MSTIDWSSKEHLYGPADDVRELLELLLSDDEGAVEEAFDGIFERFVARDGRSTSAATDMVTALLDLLAEVAHPGPVLLLIAEILGGDHLRQWVSQELLSSEGAAIAIARHTAWLPLLESDVGSVRACATVLASTVRASGAVAALSAMATQDPDPIVRASAILALAPFESPDSREAWERARVSGEPVLIGAVALAALRVDPSRSFEQEVGGLEAWLSWDAPRWSPERTEFPWFECAWASTYALARPHDGQSRVVAELARHRNATRELSALLLARAAATEAGPFTRRAGALIADLGGLMARWVHSDTPEVEPFEAFTAEEQATIRELAATPLLPNATRQMPAAGLPRRRWAEMDPSSPSTPDLLDRWESAVQTFSGAYGGMAPAPRLPLEATELALAVSAVVDPTRMTPVLDDIALRFTHSEREGFAPRRSSALTVVALLPLVRAGVSLSPQWDVIIAPSLDPLATEVFSSLELSRREPILWRELSSRGEREVAGTKEAVAAVHLAPSPRIVAALRARLAHRVVAGFFGPGVEDLRRQVDAAESMRQS